MARLLVFLPHVILEDDWHQEGGEGSSGKSPQTPDSCSDPGQRPLPFLFGLDLHTQMAPTIGAIPNQRKDARR